MILKCSKVPGIVHVPLGYSSSHVFCYYEEFPALSCARYIKKENLPEYDRLQDHPNFIHIRLRYFLQYALEGCLDYFRPLLLLQYLVRSVTRILF